MFMIDTSTGPEGYKKLIVWQIAYTLRQRVYNITKRFPKAEMRRVSQMNATARSVKQNIQEGYKQTSLPKYISYLRDIALPSLSELFGDIEDCYDDRLITEVEFKELRDLYGRGNFMFRRLINALERKNQNRKLNSDLSNTTHPFNLPKPSFENLEHTADLKIRAWGKTKEELFANMAAGIMENIGGKGVERGRGVKGKFKIESTDLEALLVDFLSQLVYLSDLHNAVFDEFKIKISNDRELQAEVSGHKVKRFALEIKAVTYHELVIKRKGRQWLAEVLFDI